MNDNVRGYLILLVMVVTPIVGFLMTALTAVPVWVAPAVGGLLLCLLVGPWLYRVWMSWRPQNWPAGLVLGLFMVGVAGVLLFGLAVFVGSVTRPENAELAAWAAVSMMAIGGLGYSLWYLRITWW